MRCSAEVCTISGGSAGCFFQLRKEIQPFILFDGHFLLHVCCSHSIPWRGRIFKSIDKHSKWFSMRKIGFKRVQRVQRVWWRHSRKLGKKGRGLRCRLCRKVVFASLRGRREKVQRVVAAAPPQFLAAVWRSVLHSVISTCSFPPATADAVPLPHRWGRQDFSDARPFPYNWEGRV